jgi:hypothetical protein
MRTSHPSYSHRCRKVSMTRRMIDNVNGVQAFLPGGDNLVESWPQKGRRTALLTKLSFLLEISNFFLMEQKSVLTWVCWLVNTKVLDRNSNFFSRYKNCGLLGFVDRQVLDWNSNFFHETKIGAYLGLLYVRMKFRRFFHSCWVLKNWNRKVKKSEWDRVRGFDGLKNRSGKCEEPGRRGLDGLKIQSGKCEGSSEGGSTGLNQTLLK